MTIFSDIRPYQLGDRVALTAVINAVCAEKRWTYTNRFEPTPAWHHALANPDCPCHLLLVVCAEDGSVVGWCDLFSTETPAEAVLGIGLLAPHRDQGWGTATLRKALQWVMHKTVRRISLVVRADNARAIHLYEKFGFTITHAVNPPYPAAGTWLEMAVEISGAGILDGKL